MQQLEELQAGLNQGKAAAEAKAATAQADNVKLFEKIKFLESYAQKKGAGVAGAPHTSIMKVDANGLPLAQVSFHCMSPDCEGVCTPHKGDLRYCKFSANACSLGSTAGAAMMAPHRPSEAFRDCTISIRLDANSLHIAEASAHPMCIVTFFATVLEQLQSKVYHSIMCAFVALTGVGTPTLMPVAYASLDGSQS